MRIRQHKDAITVLYSLSCCHQQRWVVIVLLAANSIDERVVGQCMELLAGCNLFQLGTEGSAFLHLQVDSARVLPIIFEL